MKNKDLCGFLTARIMAIGLASDLLNKGRREAKDRCSQNRGADHNRNSID
ncbi:MAG: hypothetical protein GQ545_06995 [Candidatus Aminicenantes bacterium]|nr:hypothetical protein [Candidatus Aminicenantes bacterium]